MSLNSQSLETGTWDSTFQLLSQFTATTFARKYRKLKSSIFTKCDCPHQSKIYEHKKIYEFTSLAT